MADVAQPQSPPSSAEIRLRDLDTALALDPANAMLHLRRGITLGALNDLSGAQAAFETSLNLLPRYADAWTCLGDLHVLNNDQGRAKDAFRRAVEIDPLTPGALAGFRKTAGLASRMMWRVRLWLRQCGQSARRESQSHKENMALKEAARLGALGHVAEAIDVLRGFLDEHPGNIAVTAAYAGLLAVHGNKAHGRQILERLVRWWPRDAQASYHLGVYLVGEGHSEAGIRVLAMAHALDPNGEIGTEITLASAGKGPLARLLASTVPDLFDRYAETFDAELVGRLDYRVPEILGTIISKSGRRWNRMLDIGCGTGLCGLYLRNSVKHLTGIDLSSAMIAKSRARGIYDDLHVDEACAYLARTPHKFDLVVAADVLIYIGEITELFAAVQKRLSVGGEFWFSVEAGPREGVTLVMTGRYQHSSGYLHAVANASQLRVSYEAPIQVRRGGKEYIPGLLVAVRRAS